MGMVMTRGIRFIYLFRHFNLTPVRVHTVNGLSKNIKKIKNFPMKFSTFAFEKNHCILHGQVIVMHSSKFKSSCIFKVNEANKAHDY